MTVATQATTVFTALKAIVTPRFFGINQAYRSYRAFKALDARALSDMGISTRAQDQTSFFDYVQAHDRRR